MVNVADDDRPLLQIAPMMDITYKDFRQFIRILTKRTQLWTEMLVDHHLYDSPSGRVDGFLDFGKNEHPIVCQLGGNNPEGLAKAAKIIDEWGYDEINLNCGCPSDKVKSGEFGASLMKKPEQVKDCMLAMSQVVNIPVTVKCRLGVDEFDSPEFTASFVKTVSESGVKHFIIHARKCLLQGLTPEDNRKIPPLMYDRVFRLCEEFPNLQFTLNGGVTDLEAVCTMLTSAPSNLVGVMIGRAAYTNPCLLADVDRRIYGCQNPVTAGTRLSILNAYVEYLDVEYPPGNHKAGGCQGPLKPILGLFHGLRGNSILRRNVEKLCHDKNLRVQGPGSILRQIIDMLHADSASAENLLKPLSQPQIS